MKTESEMTAAMGRRAQAEALLQNELFKGSFEALEKEYTRAWKESTARDNEAREQLWYLMSNLYRLRDHFTKVINDGKFAQDELEQLAMMRK